MTKNVLTISFADVDVKRLFNMTKNVMTYRRERLNFRIIKIIMMIKYDMQNTIDYVVIEINVFVFINSNEIFANELFFNFYIFAFLIVIENENDNENNNLFIEKKFKKISNDNNTKFLNFDAEFMFSKRKRLHNDNFEILNQFQLLTNNRKYIVNS